MLFASAQQYKETDSIYIQSVPHDGLNLSIPETLFVESNYTIDQRIQFDPSFNYQLQIADYTKYLGLSKALKSPLTYSETFSYPYFANPFYTNGFVYTQANYKLGKHVSFGGNSYGVQSVFDPLKLNPGIQNMEYKGATMYLQYKVSKNFKVETRVNISNRDSPWEP